jgi:hypothetical protein
LSRVGDNWMCKAVIPGEDEVEEDGEMWGEMERTAAARSYCWLNLAVPGYIGFKETALS